MKLSGGILGTSRVLVGFQVLELVLENFVYPWYRYVCFPVTPVSLCTHRSNIPSLVKGNAPPCVRDACVFCEDTGPGLKNPSPPE